jgi:hypothetical protein
MRGSKTEKDEIWHRLELGKKEGFPSPESLLLSASRSTDNADLRMSHSPAFRPRQYVIYPGIRRCIADTWFYIEEFDKIL